MKTTYDKFLNYGLLSASAGTVTSALTKFWEERKKTLSEAPNEEEYMKAISGDEKLLDYAYKYATLRTLERINGKLLYFVIISILSIFAGIIIALSAAM